MSFLRSGFWPVYVFVSVIGTPQLSAATISNISAWQAFGGGVYGDVIGAANQPLDVTSYHAPAPTMGEVITAPADASTLESFTFLVVPSYSDLLAFHFVAAVYEWDQSTFRPLGPPLAEDHVSPPVLGSAVTFGSFAFLKYSPNVRVTGGKHYVLVLSTLSVTQISSPGFTSLAATATDTYSGGEMVFASAGTLKESATPLSSTQAQRWGDARTGDEIQLSTTCAFKRLEWTDSYRRT